MWSRAKIPEVYISDKRSNGELCSPQLAVSRLSRTNTCEPRGIGGELEAGHLFGCSNQDRRVGSCSIILRNDVVPARTSFFLKNGVDCERFSKM